MPLTKDLICLSGKNKAATASVNYNGTGGLNALLRGSAALHSEESDEMNGVDVEFSDFEKTIAQKSIRRSVVKDKLNWSC